MEEVVESLVVGKYCWEDKFYNEMQCKVYIYNEKWGNVHFICAPDSKVERGDKILCSRLWLQQENGYLYAIAKNLTIEEMKEKFVAQQKAKQSEKEETKASKHQIIGLCEVRYGKPVCRITGKHCDKISKAEIKQNTKLKNLCEIHKCVLACNFKKIIENQH